MNLTILDRFAVMSILPTKGSFLTINVVDRLRKKLLPTPDEIERFSIVDTPSGVRWNDDGEAPREFSLDQAERDLIEEELIKADKAQSLTRDAVGIYRMFVGSRAP